MAASLNVRSEKRTTISSVHFRNFKALSDFSVSLRHMNVLVGPNNAGKSTILGAFRVLAAGLQRATHRRAELIEGPSGEAGFTPRFGYRVPLDAVPVSVANVHTDYDERTASTVTFRLTNGRELMLYWPPGSSECYLFPSRLVKSTSAFVRLYPVSIGVIPTLGPIDEHESLVGEEAVRRGLLSVRASRYFRNYWHHYYDGFDEFRSMV